MDVNKQLELIKQMIEKVDDKDLIGNLGSLADSIKEQEEYFKSREDEQLKEIANLRDAYRDSVLKGGFKSNEFKSEAEPVQENKVPSFDELLSKYSI